MITPQFTFDERLIAGSDFTNAAWAKTNITITPAFAVAPDGTNTAQKVAATATAVALMNQTCLAAGKASGKPYSIYVKIGTGAAVANAFILRNGTTATNIQSCTVNFTTGAVLTGNATMVSVGNGWWKLTLTPTAGQVSDGDDLLCYVGFVGGAQTAGDFLLAWGGSLRSSLLPTYPAVQRPLAQEMEATRQDSITSSGIKQSITERTDFFFTLSFPFVPAADIATWKTFMTWALPGGFFTYYPDSTDPTTHTDYTMEETLWAPKRAIFGHAAFQFSMRQVV
jgi:hypothetical protein